MTVVAFLFCQIGFIVTSFRAQSQTAALPGNSLALSTPAAEATAYVCPMHPNIRQHDPGTCPICGMDLVPRHAPPPPGPAATESVPVTQHARRLAGIATEQVREEIPFQTLRTVGTIAIADERVRSATARVDGRIEQMFASDTGVHVRAGDPLAEIFSPALYAAQVEYLQAAHALAEMKRTHLTSTHQVQDSLQLNAAQKLKELGMTRAQIATLKKSGRPKSRVIMHANVSGTVIEKNVITGDNVKTGQVIFKIADLSAVWLLLDLFPEDAHLLKFGLKVAARVRAAPGQTFSGRISLIRPVIDPKTQTLRVRVDLPNPDGILRPGDFADASVRLAIGPHGPANPIYDPELAGKYVSPMHPHELYDQPGTCPICGMPLVPTETFGYSASPTALTPVLTIPRDALLTVGASQAVFVETSANHFSLRQVVAGPVVDSQRMVIFSGLHAGEIIASQGAFLLDSELQLSGKPSLIRIPPAAGTGHRPAAKGNPTPPSQDGPP